MKTALLISAENAKLTGLIPFLNSEGFSDIILSHDIKQASQIADTKTFDLVLINCSENIKDEEDAAIYFSSSTKSFVVMICAKESADALADRTGKDGILVISRPINKHLFHHYLQFVSVFKKRMLGVWQENNELKHLVEEMKVINKAKYLLMQCLSMTEEQAHQYLQKQAMDMRISKYDVAVSVVRTYSS